MAEPHSPYEIWSELLWPPTGARVGVQHDTIARTDEGPGSYLLTREVTFKGPTELGASKKTYRSTLRFPDEASAAQFVREHPLDDDLPLKAVPGTANLAFARIESMPSFFVESKRVSAKTVRAPRVRWLATGPAASLLEGGNPGADGGDIRVETSRGAWPGRPVSDEDRAEALADDARHRIQRPEVISMARHAVGDATDRAEQIQRLVRFAANWITSRSHASPRDVLEVLETRAGDCKAHALLFTSLARALGIPARERMGIVYSPRHRQMRFHMWNEVELDGVWRGVDAALREPPDAFNPTHLAARAPWNPVRISQELRLFAETAE